MPAGATFGSSQAQPPGLQHPAHRRFDLVLSRAVQAILYEIGQFSCFLVEQGVELCFVWIRAGESQPDLANTGKIGEFELRRQTVFPIADPVGQDGLSFSYGEQRSVGDGRTWKPGF